MFPKCAAFVHLTPSTARAARCVNMTRMGDSETLPTARATREERKVVTALFADLVGSTALSERLEPEEVKLIVAEAVARIVRAVHEFGGTVKDLAGDGVLALFGAPIAHEDDEERALRVSLRVLEELAEYAAEVEAAWGISGFGVRVGVSTGPVVLGDVGAGARIEYAAFGDAVNTAARLEAAAEPGTVLVSAETKRRAEPLFEWGEAQPFKLKGKAELVHAAPLQGVRAAGSRPRLLHEEARFVGREAELASGAEAIEQVMRGAGGILFLTGEPGIGKSRLLDEFRRIFDNSPGEARRPLWIEGRCASYGESIPYWPFRDLIRNWLAVAADESELRVRVSLRRRLDELFGDRAPEIYPYVGSILGSHARARRREPLGRALARSAAVPHVRGRRGAPGAAGGGRPVAFALEDLHWADPTSVQLAERLLPLDEEAAILFLCYGPSRARPPVLGSEGGSGPRVPSPYARARVEPLSGDADRELFAALVGERTLPLELAERILDAAEGNPFFLEELVARSSTRGARPRRGELAVRP